jgi:hypothetical protein
VHPRGKWQSFLPVLAAWLAILLVYGGFQEDDAFITFRYARNLAEGHGFVYNLGEQHHLGTSAPLFTLVLALLGTPSPQHIPQIGFIVSALGLLACAYAMQAFWRDTRPDIGLIAALFVLVNPLTYYSLGMEMPVQAALVLWGFVLCKRGKSMGAAILLALAVLVRPDAVVALPVALGYVAWKKHAVPYKEAALILAIFCPFAVASYLYFGTFIPATAAAKQAQVESGIWLSYIPGTLLFLEQKYVIGMHMPIGGWLPEMRLTPLPLWWLVPPLLVVGACYCRRVALPVLWAAGMVVAYQLGHVTFNDWYEFPLGIGVSALLASAATLLRWRLVLAYGAVLSAFLIWYAAARAKNCVDGRKEDYILAGRWIEQNTPPGATVGFCEIGYIGWYSRHPMIDPLGLIHPSLNTHVAARDIGYAYKKQNPDYIVDCAIFNSFFNTNGSWGWIHTHYSPVVEFARPGYDPVTILRRNEIRVRLPGLDYPMDRK